MDLSSKRALFIDLEKSEGEVKTFPELKKYFGGLGIGLRLYQLYEDANPVIFSVGPLNGYFPYVSKTSVVLNSGSVMEDIYLGGYLSTRIRFADLDAIVFLNKSAQETVIELENEYTHFKDAKSEINKLGLPGKKSSLEIIDRSLVLDNYFTEKETMLAKKLRQKNIKGFVLSSTKSFNLANVNKYEELYRSLLAKTDLLKVEKGFFPSCSGCPMGCEKSRYGEMGGNVLVHSLVACDFAEKIYSDVGTVFSCLNVLGYDYTHEDIENLPLLVQNTLRSLS
jgi:aldehyde:ferredoxin oxidoreductase